MNIWADTLAVFDLETTGVDVREARIVTAVVAVIDARGAVRERRDWLADPGIEIPEGAAAVHGITTEHARAHGRPAAAVVEEIVATLRGHLDAGIPVVIYNAPYDLSVLHHEALRHGATPLGDPAPIVDPLVLDRAMDRFRPGKRTLSHTADLYGVPLDDAHDAGADAIAAGRVAQALARHYPELDVPVALLHDRQRLWYADHAVDFAAWLERTHGTTRFVSDLWPIAVPGSGRHRADPLRIAAGVICREDGALLFVRKCGTTAFLQPGGKLERGETASAALVRELREELGLVVRTEELVPLGRYDAPAANEAGVVIDAHVFEAPLRGEPAVAAEIEELAWIHPDDGEALAAYDIAPLSRDILIPLVRARRAVALGV